MPAEAKKRIEFIDLAKGLCIFLVVLAHVMSSFDLENYPLRDAMGMFRMPLYFFLSGLFFSTYENYRGFLKRKTNKLLIPFLAWYLLTVAIPVNIAALLGKNGYGGFQSLIDFIWPERIFYNGAIWFLWGLFIMNNIFYGIYLLSRRLSQKHMVALICLFSLLVGCAGYALFRPLRINLPANIDSAMTALPFFVAGYLFRRYTNLLQPNKYDKYNWLFVILFFAVVILLARYVNYSRNQYSVDIFSLYAGGLLGTLGIILLSKILKKLPLLSYCGRYSIMILVIHVLVIKAVKPLILHFCSGTVSILLTLLVAFGVSALLIPVMKKFLPHITAQKDVIPINSHMGTGPIGQNVSTERKN